MHGGWAVGLGVGSRPGLIKADGDTVPLSHSPHWHNLLNYTSSVDKPSFQKSSQEKALAVNILINQIEREVVTAPFPEM